MAKIAICMPCNRQVKTKTVESLFNLSIPFDKILVIATEGYTISENRTYLAVQALNNGCSHLLFIDDDMVFPPDTLERLLNREKDIVGVIYHSRMFPPTPVIVLEDGSVKEVKEINEEMVKCQHVGTGVLLIKTEVFKKIHRPWFLADTYLETGMTRIGEDAWFCQQARKAGYEIWCDTTIDIKHIGNFLY